MTTTQHPTTANTPELAEAAAAMAALRDSAEVRAIFERIASAQRATEIAKVWDTPTGRGVERTYGNLMMALEAAGVQF